MKGLSSLWRSRAALNAPKENSRKKELDESYKLVSSLMSLLAPIPEIVSPAPISEGGVFKIKTSDNLLIRLWQLLISESESVPDETLSELMPKIQERSRKQLWEFKKRRMESVTKICKLRMSLHSISELRRLEDELELINEATQKLETTLVAIGERVGFVGASGTRPDSATETRSGRPLAALTMRSKTNC